MLPWIYVAKESNIFFFLLYGFTDINYSFLRNKKTVIKKEEKSIIRKFFRVIWRHFIFIACISVSIYKLHNVN